ncbi:cell division protein ZapE [Chitinimonas sp. DQS-5]|uniref:Cell division protein ZapE n=2 Tax=Parachitinimonas caeni TaxID=3031301 RepID=A0ABT7E6Q6_9NEIS|nr:cell division protein ZapE [Parachitinimonas caeni]
MPPSEWYDLATRQSGFSRDAAQENAVRHLQRLFDELVAFKQKRNRLFGRSLLPQPKVPRGLYFWGGVGRGKSFLMDAFFACVPYQRKKRMHFHNFMKSVHDEMRAHSNESDPLLKVAAKIATETRLLCFDEFHVSDIADAMILGRLLKQLFELGVVLVATSNYEPDGLYPNGLQRANFLPTIALMKEKLDVVNVDGGNDYRMRTLTRARTYLSPITPETEGVLQGIFDSLAHGSALPTSLTIEGRQIEARRHVGGMVWFDFATLCGGPRSQNDYLELARQYHTILLSNVPKLGARHASEARRFTWLVDVFYDHRVKLVLSAETDPDHLYTEGQMANEFFRTASRLTEMQSQEYLALPHLAGQMRDGSQYIAFT